MENQRPYRIIKGPESIQGSDAWLAFRMGKIGASDAPSIMAVSPFETKLQCWERMVLGKNKARNKAMERGNLLEAKAREWVNKKLGTNYQPDVIQSIAYPDLIASLDGLEGDNLIEIKSPGMEAHMTALSGHIPDYYIPQLQHQLMISGQKSMKYVSFDGMTGVILDVAADQYYIDDLLAKELGFLASILNFKSPEPCSMDRIEIHDSRAIKTAADYLDVIEQIDRLQVQADNMRKELIKAANHNRAKIGPVNLVKMIRKGNIQYEDIPELKGVDLEKYRKEPIESWRVTGI